ncbi:uncharacterized protein IL334_000051 [Kwoniella shivajii]|uniref:N-acetyltransferase domain-containing protein n=1 Tax=Kwoniella shivajii TaxID=564305 RepID=A0ABZ1CNM5_9TREE|nr:hypothetical protein IL334_000051 [Kwoniella shivajii]
MTNSDLSEEQKNARCPIKYSEEDGLYIPLPSFPEYRLTPWKEEDVEHMIELYSQPNVGKWSHSRPFPYTREYASTILPEFEKHKKYLSLLKASLPNPPNLADYPSGKAGPLGALREVSTGKVIGGMNVKLSIFSPGDWDMSYNLHDGFAGKGIGTEMIKRGVDLARWLGINRIIAFTEQGNYGSNAVLRKSGFNLHSEHMVDWPEAKGGGKRAAYAWDQHL